MSDFFIRSEMLFILWLAKSAAKYGHKFKFTVNNNLEAAITSTEGVTTNFFLDDVIETPEAIAFGIWISERCQGEIWNLSRWDQKIQKKTSWGEEGKWLDFILFCLRGIGSVDENTGEEHLWFRLDVEFQEWLVQKQILANSEFPYVGCPWKMVPLLRYQEEWERSRLFPVTFLRVIAKKSIYTDTKLFTIARLWYKDGNDMNTLSRFLTFKKSYQVRCIANGLEGWNNANAFEYPQCIMRLCIGMAKNTSYRIDNPSIQAKDILSNLTQSEMVNLVSKAATRLQSALRAVEISKHLGYKGNLIIKPLAGDSKLIYGDGSYLHLNRLLLERAQIDDVEAKAALFIKEQRIKTR